MKRKSEVREQFYCCRIVMFNRMYFHISRNLLGNMHNDHTNTNQMVFNISKSVALSHLLFVSITVWFLCVSVIMAEFLESESQPILESGSIIESQAVFSESENDSQDSQCSENSENSQEKSGLKECNCEKIQGKRRDRTILHSITEHQLYVKNKALADGSIAYTCKEKFCKARIYEKSGQYFFSEPFYGHLHANKEVEIAELKVLSEIKKLCAKPTASQTTSQISEVREIFDEAVMQ